MKKVEISDTLAYILQRMIKDEIINQELWIEQEEHKFGKDNRHRETRLNIIKALEEDRENLSQQGYPPFEYYQ